MAFIHSTTATLYDGSRATKLPALRHCLALARRMPWLHRLLLTTLAIELFCALLLPILISPPEYLGLYLSDRAAPRLKQILGGETELLIDADAGWRNRPSLARGTWRTDRHGARVISRSSPRKGRPRIMLLGNSMINGGTGVSGDQTIGAYLESLDSKVETLNFGTMLYGIDQALLAYRSRLHLHRPQLVVVGVELASLAAMYNHYVPFREPQEENIPLFKPRFSLNAGRLRLQAIDERGMASALLAGRPPLEYLRDHDAYYADFASFRRFGLSPLTGGARRLYLKARGYTRLMRPCPARQIALLSAVADAFVQEAQRHRAKLIFVALPVRRDFGEGLRRFFPDRYAQLLGALSGDNRTVVDGRAVLRASSLSTAEIYDEDAVHYRPAGNRALAAGLFLARGRLLGPQATKLTKAGP